MLKSPFYDINASRSAVCRSRKVPSNLSCLPQGNFHAVPTFKCHVHLLYVLKNRVTVLDTFEPLRQPHQDVDHVSQDLLLGRADPRTARKREKFPVGFTACPTVWFELLDIVAPDVFVVMHAPHPHTHCRAFGDEDGAFPVTTAARGQDGVAYSSTHNACCRPDQASCLE